jgi:1-acyl-sn-glycerol-3-phosphate acyltransferase
MEVWAICLLFVLIAALGWWLLPSCRRARKYMKDVSQCGFLAPPPTVRATRLLVRVCKVLLFIQVGRMKVIGEENLENLPGPCIVTPNHPHSADVIVMPLVYKRPARYMAAQGVMTAFGGFGALIAGPMGGFCVDITPGNGGPAHDASVKIVTNNELLNMFPEGHTHLEGRMGVMKKGAIRIGKEAAAKLGKEVYLIPSFLRYGRYPGPWINKITPPWDYAFLMAFAWYFRSGVTVTIGKPIPVSELPEDLDEAIEFLRKKIVELDPLGRNGEP